MICIRENQMKDSFLRIVNRCREVLSSDTRLMGAYLVGSLARGEADENSDIDLCVVTDGQRHQEVLSDAQATAICIGEALTTDWLAGATCFSAIYAVNEAVVKVDFDYFDLPTFHNLAQQSAGNHALLSHRTLLFDHSGELETHFRNPRLASPHATPRTHGQFLISAWNVVRMLRRGEVIDAIDNLNRMRDPWLTEILCISQGVPFENYRRIETRLPAGLLAQLVDTFALPTQSGVAIACGKVVNLYIHICSELRYEFSVTERHFLKLVFGELASLRETALEGLTPLISGARGDSSPSVSAFESTPPEMATLAAHSRSHCPASEAAPSAKVLAGRRIDVPGLELNIVEHCNLRCAHCDHSSPLLPPKFVSPKTVAAQLQGLSAVLRVQDLRLLGGEPLLHPEILACVGAARDSGIARRIILVTNGVLLEKCPHRAALWDLVNGVFLSVYPGVPGNQDLESVVAEATARGVWVRERHITEFQASLLRRPLHNASLVQFVYDCCRSSSQALYHTLRDGTYYMCPPAAFMRDRLRALGITDVNLDDDGIHTEMIAKCPELLLDYLGRQHPLGSCAYCLGPVARSVPHHQLRKQDYTDSDGTGLVPVRALIDRSFKLPHKWVSEDTVASDASLLEDQHKTIAAKSDGLPYRGAGEVDDVHSGRAMSCREARCK